MCFCRSIQSVFISHNMRNPPRPMMTTAQERESGLFDMYDKNAHAVTHDIKDRKIYVVEL